MPVSTPDGRRFDSESDYWHDMAFNEPKRQKQAMHEAALEPHKNEYLANNPDMRHDQIVWPKDTKGIEYLKRVNESDKRHKATHISEKGN
jgi:hypothetical protein